MPVVPAEPFESNKEPFRYKELEIVNAVAEAFVKDELPLTVKFVMLEVAKVDAPETDKFPFEETESKDCPEVEAILNKVVGLPVA